MGVRKMSIRTKCGRVTAGLMALLLLCFSCVRTVSAEDVSVTDRIVYETDVGEEMPKDPVDDNTLETEVPDKNETEIDKEETEVATNNNTSVEEDADQSMNVEETEKVEDLQGVDKKDVSEMDPTAENKELESGVSETSIVDENVLEKHRKEGLTPKGTVINLFDYWLTEREDQDNEDATDALRKSGINSGGIWGQRYLTFLKNASRLSYLKAWNKWTGNRNPYENIVKPTLDEEGYPYIYGEMNGTYQTESLSYLFDPAEETEGKLSFPDVDGLLQIDEEGYYYYNSQKNFAEFDEKNSKFLLYDTWGVKPGGGSPNGQFFPFNKGSQVFSGEIEGRLLQKEKEELDSNSAVMNHYFGLTMATRFIQQEGGKTADGKPVTYEFSGDDDVWVFIDGVLVADLGGIHNAASLKIDFTNGQIYINEMEKGTLKEQFQKAGKEASVSWQDNTFADNTYHTLNFFYLERGNTDSNMALKYNLVTIPESGIVKIDQWGDAVPGAGFELQEAEKIENTGVYVAKSNGAVYTGTTDSRGEMTFYKGDGLPVSLQELNDKSQYYILKETKVPEGYRKSGDMNLYFWNGVLLSENHWDTGAYASVQVRTKLDNQVKDVNERIYSDQELREGTVFGVVLKRKDLQEDLETKENWYAVYGDNANGWHLTQNSGISGVLEAANQNLYEVLPSSDGSWMVDINNIPGSIQKYYWMLKNGEGNINTTEFTVAYYYTSADEIQRATTKNTVRLDSDSYDRIFSVRLDVPNIKNRFVVQKTDEAGTPVNGATFYLYEESETEVNGQGERILKSGANPFDCAMTSKLDDLIESDGSVLFPSENKKLPNGTYYVQEQNVPAGYELDSRLIKVIVNNTGIYADAGEKDDPVSVQLGVGRLVRSMLQFAVDDDIDATLHDINGELVISEEEPVETGSINWAPADGEVNKIFTELTYSGSEKVQEYGAKEGWQNYLTVDAGWSDLKIKQGEKSGNVTSPREELSDQDLTNLFSGVVILRLANNRSVVEGELMGQKTLIGATTEVLPSFTFCMKPDEKAEKALKAGGLALDGVDENEDGSYGVEVKMEENDINSENGVQQSFSLGKLTAKEPGQYSFTVKEQKKEDTSIFYDSHQMTINVEVQINNGTKAIKVTYDNSEALTEADRSETQKATFTNYILQDFEFKKQDGETSTPLSDAYFVLYRSICENEKHDHTEDIVSLNQDGGMKEDYQYTQCWEKVETVTSNEEGVVTFTKLIPGEKYRLAEYRAPGGYMLPEGQWTITWDKKEGNFSFDTDSAVGNPPAVKGDASGYVIPNYRPSDLPLTGSGGIGKILILGGILMTIGISGVIYYIYRHKKRRV